MIEMIRACGKMVAVQVAILILFAATLFGGPGCTTVSAASPVVNVPQPTVKIEQTVEDITLAPGDLFEIRVYGEKELCGEFRVESNGTFDYLFLGKVKVGGLTPSEVSELLETMFIDGDFLKNPQVSVLVKKYSSKKVSVFGQVNRPGTFPWQEGMGVVEAISLAGGFTPMAKTEHTMVTRMVNGQKKNYVVSVEEIGEGKSPDLSLRPGDIVYVPERIF